MITLSVTVPESVAAEYYEAADRLNQLLGTKDVPVQAKGLMAFVLARYDAGEVAGQFDLALRAVRGIDVPPLPNPVVP